MRNNRDVARVAPQTTAQAAPHKQPRQRRPTNNREAVVIPNVERDLRLLLALLAFTAIAASE